MNFELIPSRPSPPTRRRSRRLGVSEVAGNERLATPGLDPAPRQNPRAEGPGALAASVRRHDLPVPDPHEGGVSFVVLARIAAFSVRGIAQISVRTLISW